MSDTKKFDVGDYVRHEKRPEWGVGVVVKAQRVTHDGVVGQRLGIRFESQGLITVNTAVIGVIERCESGDSEGQACVDGVEDRDEVLRRLSGLPAGATDPRLPLAPRLGATLDLYRFGHDLRSVFDWAVAQTGMRDPLGEYSRHELELAFLSFEKKRERCLGELVSRLKYGCSARRGRKEAEGEKWITGKRVLREAMSRHNAAAREALRRAMN